MENLSKLAGNAGAMQGFEEACAAALGFIERYCGWHVTPERTDTVTVDGNGLQVLQLPSLHVLNVERVELDGEELDGSCFSWSDRGMLRLRHGVWPREFRNVTVTLRHGYKVCPDIESVVAVLAARAVSTPTGVAAITVGGRSERYGADSGYGISPTSKEYAVLDAYRIPLEV